MLLGGCIGIMEKKMEITGVIGDLITPENCLMEKNETTIVYWVYIGIMGNNMETTIVYWGYMGFQKIGRSLLGPLSIIGVLLYLGVCRWASYRNPYHLCRP